jgi:hypothetical protein
MAAAGPEIPAAGAFSIALLALLAALGLLMLRQTVQVLIGESLNALASLLPGTFGIRSTVQNGIQDAVDYVASQLASWQLQCDKTAEMFFRDAETLTRDTYDAILGLSNAAAHGFKALVTSVIPHAVQGALGTVKTQVTNVTQHVTHITRYVTPTITKTVTRVETVGKTELTHLEARVATLEHTIPNEITKAITGPLNAAIGKVETEIGAIPLPVPVPLPALRDYVDKKFHGIDQELDRLTKKVAPGAIGILALSAVLHDLPHLNCDNNKRVGRALCRFPVKALEDLLGGLAEAVIVTDLCLLFKAMDKLAVVMKPYISDATKALGHFITCRSISKAAPVKLTHHSVPAPFKTLTLT